MKTPKITFVLSIVGHNKHNIKTTKPVKTTIGSFNCSYWLEENCGIKLSNSTILNSKKPRVYAINNLIFKKLQEDKNNLLEALIEIQRI